MTDVLCYGFDPQRSALQDIAHDLVRRQRENTREVFEKLQEQGHIPEHASEELPSLLEKPSSQQPHELVALLGRYMGETKGASAGRVAWEAGCTIVTNDIAAVVEAAHQSGGVSLLAHPGRGDGFTDFDVQLLDELRQEVPFDGLEAYYPRHTPEQTAMFLDYARKHNLLVSSGSDSHNSKKKPIKYRADLSRELLEHVGIRIKT